MDATIPHLDHPFILLIKKAEHAVIEKSGEQSSLITKNKLEFNGFSKIDEFKKELNLRFDNYFESFEDEINLIQLKSDRIKLLNTILKDLHSVKDNVFILKGDKITQHFAYNLNNDLKDDFYSDNESSMCYEFFVVQHEYLNKCIARIKQEKQDLESLTQEDIDRTYGTSSSDVSKCIGIKKIKTSLTVQELAFLFKILEESELFTPENKGDWGKVVVELFKTDRINSISYKSFMNEYYKKEEDLEDVADKFLGKFIKLEDILDSRYR